MFVIIVAKVKRRNDFKSLKHTCRGHTIAHKTAVLGDENHSRRSIILVTKPNVYRVAQKVSHYQMIKKWY